MALFQKATQNQAYLKMGIYGNAGSGKTYTASRIAEGFAQYLKERGKATPPVMFLDTETGSNWVAPLFAEAGIDFQCAYTRSFADLKTAVKEADAAGAILIVDSITHFWQELCLTFAQQRKRRDNKLEFQDYAAIKPMWAGFTDSYLNSKAHIILCGRAGNVWEYQDKEDGSSKKELISTGTKMKAESEMGYEPSLLVEMVAVKDPDRKKKLTKRVGYVIKDRSTVLDGREFINPTFKTFLPHIERLNIGGQHLGFDESRNSSGMLDSNARPDHQRVRLQKDIVLEEIQELLVLSYPGQSADEKKAKVQAVRTHFNAVWKELETMLTLEQLQQGYDSMHMALMEQPSRYHRERPEQTSPIPPLPEFDDEIPY